MERRLRILDAAERCIVRAGFHRTTMQDVAAEAGMSPGNLYRYFSSKDAIVAGLAERDRAQVVGDFSTLADSSDFMRSLAELGRKHLSEEPRARAILCLEIWAEATRNEAFTQITADFDRAMTGRIVELFRRAQGRGEIPPGIDVEAAATVISIMADGLYVRRAISRKFDADREVGHVLAVIEAMMKGAIDLEKRAGEMVS